MIFNISRKTSEMVFPPPPPPPPPAGTGTRHWLGDRAQKPVPILLADLYSKAGLPGRLWFTKAVSDVAVC